MLRTTATRLAPASADSVVVGAGPAGIAVLGHLLHNQQQPQSRSSSSPSSTPSRNVWVDPSFSAGRVSARYRLVPSNTKVDLFCQFASTLPPLNAIVSGAAEPNAFTELRALRQDKGCELGKAADLLLMLSEGLGARDDVARAKSTVRAAELDVKSNTWRVSIDGREKDEDVLTRRLVLCTGSSPITAPLPVLQSAAPPISQIHLDTALNPPLLADALDRTEPRTVAVIGASHSAILVLMNLYALASTTHPHLRIKWFTRHEKLRYAVDKGGWILYDNTGLKGEAAEWARANLEADAFASSPASAVITRLHTPTVTGEEEALYRAELPGCSNVVQAVGYKRDPLPELTVAGTQEPIGVEHDGLTGRFFSSLASSAGKGGQTYVPGLFGAGIAFPERVTDPAGNVEHAVGFWKFMKFLNRVVPQWVSSTGQ